MISRFAHDKPLRNYQNSLVGNSSDIEPIDEKKALTNQGF